MAIKLGSNDDPEEMVDINTTPLIDVMLVLLIMLIITIQTRSSFARIGVLIYDGVEPIDLGGTAGVVSMAQQPDQPEVHINPNKLASYGTVIGVMAAAEREGVTKIGIVGNEQFAP